MNIKLTFLAFLICFFNLDIYAQEKKIISEDQFIVTDSVGKAYAYEFWKAAIKTGNYTLKRQKFIKGESPKFILHEFTEQELDEKASKLDKPKESGSFVNGTSFKYFNLTDINRKKITSKELTGKILVINFWFINCPPCRKEIPDLNNLAAKYANNKDVVFVAIALDSEDRVQDFIKTNPFNYFQVGDGRFYAEKFEIKSYPTHVIINREGKVYFNSTSSGRATNYWLKKSINELL